MTRSPERNRERNLYSLLGHIPAEKKNYVMLVSDNHGSPPLIANHGAPVGREILDPDAEDFDSPVRHRVPDALNLYGIWKLFDGLTDAAFFGKNIQNAPWAIRRNSGIWGNGAMGRR